MIDGLIISPKDVKREKVESLLEMAAGHDADRLFDPQFYACFRVDEEGARLGKLSPDEYPYMQRRRRVDLEREANLRRDIDACLRFQAELDVSAFIAPNIVIRRSLDSSEAMIARNFIRNTAEMAGEIGDGRPVYATLAIAADALAELSDLNEFLFEITGLDSRPDGFYLIIEHPGSDVPPSLEDSRVLGRWMFINHALKIAGFDVINGFSDLLTPYLGAAGGTAGAAGWFNTLKMFSLNRFGPASGMARQPVARYTSRRLLKSLRYPEFHDNRRAIPRILNGRATDNFYPEEDGSLPEGNGECLQNWDAIKQMTDLLVVEGDPSGSLDNCDAAFSEAEEIYQQFNARGYPLRDRSSRLHLDSLREASAHFRALAEL